jgi:hypothetical protein
VQPWKANSSIDLTDVGRQNDSSDEQSLNDDEPIVCSFDVDSKITVEIEAHPKKQWLPIISRDEGD